jgi:hypothetical protein
VIPAPEPLIFALTADESEQFLIIEGSDAHRTRDTPEVHGPMREDKLRAVLTDRFGMAPEVISRRVEQARQHLRERTTDAPFVFASHPLEEAKVTFVERRNHTSRAARMKRLLDVVASTPEGLSLTELAAELSPAAAERILKPLALRGLVKVHEGRWLPQECLKVGMNLSLLPE